MRPSDSELQAHVANAAISASTVRGRGNAGVAFATRDFLSRLSLTQFTVIDESSFLKALDHSTADLANNLPTGAQHWGIAGKCLNIFLRDAFYNRFISHPLLCCEQWFEIPLDSVVAKKLREKDPTLPKWLGVKQLTVALSSTYQQSAKDLALANGYPRVYLDSVLWPTGRAGP